MIEPGDFVIVDGETVPRLVTARIVGGRLVYVRDRGIVPVRRVHGVGIRVVCPPRVMRYRGEPGNRGR